MKLAGIGTVLAVSLVLGGAAHATLTTANYRIQGVSCSTSTTAGVVPALSQYGVNAGNTAMNVVCPVILPSQTYSYAYISVVGYNRSSTDNVFCNLGATDTTGASVVSSNATLTGNQAGSVSATTSITPSDGYVYLWCHLPAQTASGTSHLSSIFLQVGY